MDGRVLWSRNPNEYELETVKEYVKELIDKRVNVSSQYMYINLDTPEGGIEIINYPVGAIKVLSQKLECRPMDALYCAAMFPGFQQDLMSYLYWNDINDLRKHIVTTKEYNEMEEEVLRTAVCYSSNKKEARLDFEAMGFLVHSIEDVDE